MPAAAIAVPTVSYSIQWYFNGSWQLLEDGIVTPDIAICFLEHLRERFGRDNVHLFRGGVILTKGVNPCGKT